MTASLARPLKAELAKLGATVEAGFGTYIDEYGKTRNGGRKYRANYNGWTIHGVKISKEQFKRILNKVFKEYCKAKGVTGILDQNTGRSST